LNFFGYKNTVMLTILCRDRDRPVPVLSNAVFHASLLRPKASSVPKRPLISDRSIAFYSVLKRS